MEMFLRFQLVLSLAVFICINKTLSVAIVTCADHFGDEKCQYTLHWAALSGDVKGAMDAIQLGKDINEDLPGYGTPLHQASFYGRAPMVKLLLQNGADSAKTDLDGDTPVAATDIKWCFNNPNDKTCQMKPTDYRETIYLLTSGCKTNGCSEGLRCYNNKCLNLCDGKECGVYAVCAIHNDRPMCQCNGDEYSGDPNVLCLKMGEAKHIYKAFCFVQDVVVQISSAIYNDIKNFVL